VAAPPNTLDEKCVLEHFLGKTQEEATQMFPSSSMCAEDFMYMAAAGLCYYLPAAMKYLRSDASKDDWIFAHGLMCSLSAQVGIFGMRGEPLILIKQIADYCDTHRAKFDIESPEDLFDDYLETIRQAI
jgi:hypothetical protein